MPLGKRWKVDTSQHDCPVFGEYRTSTPQTRGVGWRRSCQVGRGCNTQQRAAGGRRHIVQRRRILARRDSRACGATAARARFPLSSVVVRRIQRPAGMAPRRRSSPRTALAVCAALLAAAVPAAFATHDATIDYNKCVNGVGGEDLGTTNPHVAPREVSAHVCSARVQTHDPARPSN